MKKEKIVLSLIIMVVLILGLTMNSLATGESKSITITPNGGSSSTNNSTTISANNSAVADDDEVGASNNSTRISANTANNSATAGASSSYRNVASNIAEESADSLPYTGTSYGVVFVIIALVVSAIYAYKKVSDYNM